MSNEQKKSPRRAVASDAVRDEWLRRVQAEYRSATLTHHLTLWLLQLGTSPDLIHDGLRIVKDELAHARLSHTTYRAAGGKHTPILDQTTLRLSRNPAEPLHLSAARAGIEVFCLGETIAVPLFKVLRESCTIPPARRALDRILRDEVRHRDFGWDLLDSFLEQPFGPDVRTLIEQELPAMFTRLRNAYGRAETKQQDRLSAEDRTWGLMPPKTYQQIFERSLKRDFVPRFQARGFSLDKALATISA